MTPRWKLFSVVVITVIILSFPMAGCVPASGEPAMDTVSSMETLQAALTQTAQAIQQSNSPSRTITWTPTFTLTPELLPTLTDTLEPTPTGLEQIPTESIVLSSFIPQGARARLGRGTINQVAVSPDGKTLAVAGATGLFLFDAETYDEIWSVPTSIAMTHITFSPDGGELTSLQYHPLQQGLFPRGPAPYEINGVYQWDASNGQLQRILPIHEYSPDEYGLAFSADGGKLALGLDGGIVKVWDLDNGKLRFTLQDDDLYPIKSIAFSQDGKSFTVGSYLGTIISWNTENGNIIRKIKEIVDGLESIVSSPDGALLAINRGKTVDIWDMNGNMRLRSVEGNSGRIRTLSFSPDGNMLVAGDDQGTVIQWDTKSGHCLRTHKVLGERTQSVVFSPDGKILIAGFMSSLQIWDSADGRDLHTVIDLFSNWNEAKYLSYGGEIALRTEGKIVYFDTLTNKNLQTVEYPRTAILSSDYRMYAYLSSNNDIIVANIVNGKALHLLRKPEYMDTGEYWNIIISPDGKTVATIQDGPDTYAADIWNLESGKLLKTFEFPIYSSNDPLYLSYSLDGKRVALGVWDWEYGMTAAVYDIASGKQYTGASNRGGYLLAFSPDGNDLFSFCEEVSNFCLVDGESGEVVQEFIFPAVFTNKALSFSFDGKMLAAGSDIGLVNIWNTSTGQILFTFQSNSAQINNLSFSPDKKTIASVLDDGTVVLWDLSS